MSKENPESNWDKELGGDPSKYGYDLYPSRNRTPRTFTDILLNRQGSGINKLKCEEAVYQCVKKNKLVRLMMSALEKSGCGIDIRRHIACEPCDSSVTGGYDPLLNQIVVCENLRGNTGLIQGVLAHEMIHMFDYCNHKLDFKNVDHVACTEVRAANLTHCSFMSAWIQGDVHPFNFRQQHQDCVKTKALYSLMAVRDISEEEAVKVIERVFPKCYNDLEPIGRRIKKNSHDMERAYKDAFYYGYV